MKPAVTDILAESYFKMRQGDHDAAAEIIAVIADAETGALIPLDRKIRYLKTIVQGNKFANDPLADKALAALVGVASSDAALQDGNALAALKRTAFEVDRLAQRRQAWSEQNPDIHGGIEAAVEAHRATSLLTPLFDATITLFDRCPIMQKTPFIEAYKNATDDEPNIDRAGCSEISLAFLILNLMPERSPQQCAASGKLAKSLVQANQTQRTTVRDALALHHNSDCPLAIRLFAGELFQAISPQNRLKCRIGRGVDADSILINPRSDIAVPARPAA